MLEEFLRISKVLLIFSKSTISSDHIQISMRSELILSQNVDSLSDFMGSQNLCESQNMSGFAKISISAEKCDQYERSIVNSEFGYIWTLVFSIN